MNHVNSLSNGAGLNVLTRFWSLQITKIMWFQPQVAIRTWSKHLYLLNSKHRRNLMFISSCDSFSCAKTQNTKNQTSTCKHVMKSCENELPFWYRKRLWFFIRISTQVLLVWYEVPCELGKHKINGIVYLVLRSPPALSPNFLQNRLPIPKSFTQDARFFEFISSFELCIVSHNVFDWSLHQLRSARAGQGIADTLKCLIQVPFYHIASQTNASKRALPKLVETLLADRQGVWGLDGSAM